MKLKIILPLSMLFILLGFAAFKMDDDPFTLLLKKLDDYTSKYPQEKVHLHLDKPYYAIGDDIWLKGYVFNTKTSAPTSISKILYVDLINEKDSIKRQLRLPLMGGVTWGDFKLTDSLGEGNYRIRAYTAYMRNFGTDFFFDKTIKIGNSWANKVFTRTKYDFQKENNTDKVTATVHFEDKNGIAYKESDVSYDVQLDFRSVSKGKVKTNLTGDAVINFVNNQSFQNKTGKIVATITLENKQKVTKSIPITSTSNDVDVQFMPEGGTLVEELPQRIAIKALNSTGHGEDVKGSVFDDSGNAVTSFETSFLGMGSFVFNMQSGKTYTAKIKFKDGSEKDFKLPLAQKSGYAIAINNVDTAKVGVKIMASESLLNSSELKVVAQQAGNVYYVSKAKMDKQVLIANIPRKNLPDGIVQFTLFSADNQPIAERLIFLNPKNDIINVALNNSVSTAKRGKSAFTFDATNQQKPVLGSFSVAVTNATKVTPDEDNETNILTSLLLTSDLAGYIEKPNHYFLNDDAKTLKELDNLMLTQGWRRFTWKNVINNVNPNITYKPEESLKISGTVTKGNKPVVGGKVMLMATKGTMIIIDTVTNADGRFVFDNLSFGDSTKFVVQARTKTERKFVDINLDVVPGQIVTKNKNGADIDINVNNTLMKYIKESDNYFNEMTRLGLLERTIKLEEVTITEKKNPAKNSSNLNGAGRADYIMTADDLSTCVTLSMCLQGRLPGVIFKGNVPYLMRSQNTPMHIVVDGMQVESEFLDNISPTDVESIELLKSIGNTAIYGMNGSGGVLVITTKRGDGGSSSYNRYAPGVVTYNPNGISISREFYAPKYDANTTSTKADLRTTIYWNPQVVSDKEGKAKFEFYNADEPGTYRVVIEGVDAVGHMARKVFTYEVK